MQRNVSLMFTCYRMYQDLALKMGGDTVKAMAELTAATALLVDGGKVADKTVPVFATPLLPIDVQNQVGQQKSQARPGRALKEELQCHSPSRC
jgi:hypothetical protein